MSSLISAILGVFGYIIIGFIIKKLNFISKNLEYKYNFISFNILLPIALISNFWKIQFPEILIYQILISFFGAGIIIFMIGFFFSKKFFYRFYIIL